MQRSRVRSPLIALAVIAALCLSAPAHAATFVRGDVNASGTIDISDAVRALMYLFVGGEPSGLPCLAAADVDDDGDVNITDAIYLLGFLFLGATAPPPPYPDCGDDPTGADLGCETFFPCSADYQLLQSEIERDMTPGASDDDLAELVEGNTAFALDLYRAVRGQPGNIFVSPHSISVALAMTYAGARGETEAEMRSAMHFTLPQATLHPAFNRLDLELASRSDSVEPDAEGDAFRLRVANSIWGQAGYGFLAQYLDTLAESYGAGLRLLDFESGPDAGRRVINQWVLDQTEGRIEDLLPEGSILTTTRLVLTNAIYFKASWLVPFDERNTQPGPFHREDGSQVTVDLMQESATYGVSTGPGYSAVEMLYLGEQLSMVVIVPEGQTLAELEADLTPPALQSILDSLQLFYIHLVFPKFTFEFELPLVPVLQALGMTTAFQWPGADFSGIDGTRDLYVQEVRHKAFVGVDEAGTEAAAATAVVVGIVSVPPEVRVDRPFIFLIRDIPTGAILFLGRVVDPAP